MEQIPNIVDGKLHTSEFYAAHDTQKHEIGLRYRMDDRSFRYMYAGNTLNCDLGCKPYNQQIIAYTSIAADAIIGATKIVIDVKITDGNAGNGEIAKDALFGGSIVIFPHDQNSISRRIIGNTANEAGAGEITVELDAGIPVALDTDNDNAECMASHYSEVRTSTSEYRSVIAMPVVAAVAGQWLWGQTWGPCWIAPQGAVSTGYNDRQVVFRHDGSIDQHDYNDAHTKFAQHAGFVLCNARGNGQGAAFIMLQICP